LSLKVGDNCDNSQHDDGQFVFDWCYILEIIYKTIMEKRGPKTQFTNVACPNKECELYGLTGQDNVAGNGLM